MQVTRCLLKLHHKHHATCALLAIQKPMLEYDRKVVKRRSNHERYHSNDALSNIFAGDQYLQSCLLRYPSRTLLQYFAVTERHTEREVWYKYLIRWNSWGIRDLDHLGNWSWIRCIHATCSGRLNNQFPWWFKSRICPPLFHCITHII